MKKVSVIGDGGWGTSIALLLASKGFETVFWSVSPEYAEFLDKNRENVKFLKGVNIPADIKITSNVSLVEGSDYTFFVVPCEYLRKVAESFSDINIPCIISATKGIENGSLKRPSEILSEVFTSSCINVLSGPSISVEVARNVPTAVVVASYGYCGKGIQEVLTTDNFRVYTSSDIIGVEMGGALKNVIAIAAGISDGLGFGTNTKAAILTRGLAEITRLGMSAGADRATFSGLSGIGDLATTCISKDSRNRWFGEEIGKGGKAGDIIRETEMVVEGMATAKSAYELAGKYNVDMPITRKVYEVIYEDKDPASAVKELMSRDLKDED